MPYPAEAGRKRKPRLILPRQGEDFRSVVLVFEADQRERARGLDAIVTDVLTKPFSLADLRSTVNRALAA